MAGEAKKSKSKGQKSGEDIFREFQALRNEQRQLANKLSELEIDLNEHKIVIDTLKDIDGDRRCYRLVGGVLVERTVKEVFPALVTNKDQLSKVIETLQSQLGTKGQEINEYKEKYNIRIRGQDDIPSSQAEKEQKSSTSSQGVLVSNKS